MSRSNLRHVQHVELILFPASRSVDDLQAACDRMQSMGVKFKKLPSEGKMRNIAFAYDPDGYWVEVIAHGNKGN